MSFRGLRVLSLESRRAAEMEQLIRKQDGEPFVAPSVREIPLEENSAAFAFAERLFAGAFDMVILLTGVGTRQLNRLLATRLDRKSTRLNSSHLGISYAVFCLKKKKK